MAAFSSKEECCLLENSTGLFIAPAKRHVPSKNLVKAQLKLATCKPVLAHGGSFAASNLLRLIEDIAQNAVSNAEVQSMENTTNCVLRCDAYEPPPDEAHDTCLCATVTNGAIMARNSSCMDYGTIWTSLGNFSI